MNSIISSELSKVASNVAAPLVTPITNLVAQTPVASMVETTAEASVATGIPASSVAGNTAAKAEKMILGISQKNLMFGAAVFVTVAAAGTGFAIYRHKKLEPKKGYKVILTKSYAKGIGIGSADLKKLPNSEKKEAKELMKAMKGLSDEQLMDSLLKIAASEKPELMGIDITKFLGTNIKFDNTNDIVAMGAAIFRQMSYRALGYSTIMQFDDDGEHASITVFPVVHDKPVTDMEVVNA